MSAAWNDIFRLPPTALAGRRVPKTALVRNAGLTRFEQKTLDKVSLLEHFASVQKSTVRIPSHVDGERDIQSVIFLRCELKGTASAYGELGQLIHKCFPNPTAILFEGADEVCVSCSVTRRSLAEHGATVVESVDMTGGFRLGDGRYAPFLESLAFDKLPQDDLYAYVHELSWRVRLARLVASTLAAIPGGDPGCLSSRRGSMP